MTFLPHEQDAGPIFKHAQFQPVALFFIKIFHPAPRKPWFASAPVNDKNIRIILCTEITLKWHFFKPQHEFLYKFYIFGVWSINISIYVEQNLVDDIILTKTETNLVYLTHKLATNSRNFYTNLIVLGTDITINHLIAVSLHYVPQKIIMAQRQQVAEIYAKTILLWFFILKLKNISKF
jgi:hypothetical protein